MLTLIPTSVWSTEATIDFAATSIEVCVTGAKVTVGRDVGIDADAAVLTWLKDITGRIGCVAICTNACDIEACDWEERTGRALC